MRATKKPYKGGKMKIADIATKVGVTRARVDQVLKSGLKKCKLVAQAQRTDEYDRVFARSAEIVAVSVERSLQSDDFIVQLTNRLAYWMLEERAKPRL